MRDTINWENANKTYDRDGYIILQKMINRKSYRKPEHLHIWEKYNGELPKDMIIHHLDEDKKNNDIKNLIALTRIDHNRLHYGYKLINGEWYKNCPMCGILKKLDLNNFWVRKNSFQSKCIPCQKKYQKKRR